MRNIDSKSRPRTQFRFKYLAVRIRLLRLGGSLTTFSTVSVTSGHFALQSACLLYPRKRTLIGAIQARLNTPRSPAQRRSGSCQNRIRQMLPCTALASAAVYRSVLLLVGEWLTITTSMRSNFPTPTLLFSVAFQ